MCESNFEFLRIYSPHNPILPYYPEVWEVPHTRVEGLPAIFLADLTLILPRTAYYAHAEGIEIFTVPCIHEFKARSARTYFSRMFSS